MCYKLTCQSRHILQVITKYLFLKIENVLHESFMGSEGLFSLPGPSCPSFLLGGPRLHDPPIPRRLSPSISPSASMISTSLASGIFPLHLMVPGSPRACVLRPLQPSPLTTRLLPQEESAVWFTYQHSFLSKRHLGSLLPWVISDFFTAESNNTLQSLFRNSLGKLLP